MIVMAGFGERQVVEYLNRIYKRDGIQAYAYRMPQVKYRMQVADVLSDSPIPEYYMVIEVKSVLDRDLYFSILFRSNKKTGYYQLAELCEFSERTGRKAFVVFAQKLKKVEGKRREVRYYTIDAHRLFDLYSTGVKKFTVELECYEGIVFPPS